MKSGVLLKNSNDEAWNKLHHWFWWRPESNSTEWHQQKCVTNKYNQFQWKRDRSLSLKEKLIQVNTKSIFNFLECCFINCDDVAVKNEIFSTTITVLFTKITMSTCNPFIWLTTWHYCGQVHIKTHLNCEKETKLHSKVRKRRTKPVVFQISNYIVWFLQFQNVLFSDVY